MNKHNCFLLGSIAKNHGYNGNVKVKIYKDIEFDIKKIDYLFIEEESSLIPYLVEDIKKNKQNLIIKFEGIDTEEDSISIRNKKLYIEKKNSTSVLTKSDNDLTGFNVFDKKFGEIGVVKFIQENLMQRIIHVNNKNDKEILIPFHNNFITEIDTKNKILYINVNEDLIFLNS